MAKAEHDKTPLEVAKVSTERLQEQAPWALAVAQSGIQLYLGEKFPEKKPVEFENLRNWFAQQLVHAKANGKEEQAVATKLTDYGKVWSNGCAFGDE